MIAFLDCYIKDPVNHSVNEFIASHPIPYTYHCPAKFGLNDLYALKQKPSAFIILGSASNVTDNEAWHQELIDYIIPHLNAGTPVLGLCFGHQLLASYFGSTIDFAHSDQNTFEETRVLNFKQDFLDFKRNDIIELPFVNQQIITKLGGGLKEIAGSDSFSNEIIMHTELPFIGTQSHPEASFYFLKNDVKLKTNYQQIQSNGHLFIKSFLKHYL